MALGIEVVNGVKSECYHSLPSNDKRATAFRLFFVPGNPGSLGFYTSFFDQLIDSLRKVSGVPVALHSVAHAGHHLDDSGDANEKRRRFNLQYQVEHKVAFIQQYASKDDSAQICLVGHSIGCYVTAEALALLPQHVRARVVFISFIMPFVNWSNLPLLHKFQLSAFSSTYPLSGRVILCALDRLSLSTKRRLVRLTMPDTVHADMVADVLHQVAGNFVKMGIDEIQLIARPESTAKMLKHLQVHEMACPQYQATHVIYTRNDKWAPHRDALLFEEHLVSGAVTVIDGLDHAFSLDAVMTDKVVKALTGQLLGAMPGLRSKL